MISNAQFYYAISTVALNMDTIQTEQVSYLQSFWLRFCQVH